ncbi:MAG: cytidine 5'-phosphate N-acetylneuraminic acid synthetase [Campylobacterales bacterium]|nr:cytidine 5'-phosphate N-acetylneuraminic acid synthetase [Campylobacterales bacterium]
MDNLLVVIPAIKKSAVIPDQLIKKLNGITLIQRAINTALEITTNKNILVITDSEEISLICERNEIKSHKDPDLKFTSENILDSISFIVKEKQQSNVLLYRANTPLVDSEVLKIAYKQFLEDEKFILTSVKKEQRKLLQMTNGLLHKINDNEYFEELKAFHIFNKNYVKNRQFKPFIIETEKSIEIESYQDWWVCEKVLQRKKIVFNVIGNIEIGMGHIYHSLALAHEITSHEVIFVCDEQYKIAVDKIASMDYRVISTDNVLSTILNLNPNMVINDILNTDEKYIKILKEHNIKVVNFEDLGSGSKYADLVFNELYDEPQLEGDNYLWGYEYLALRDEFYEATPHKMVEEISDILVTFGGTYQNNLTLATLKSIVKKCQEKNIKINIVCGGAYKFKEELENYLQNLVYKNISLTYASGVISKIMEKSQLAISSNGRTIYELADMNIPSIIVSHHEREATHSFATLDKGFINLGVIDENTSIKIKERFEKLVDDRDYRELLFMNIKKYSFRENKQKVVKKILELL